ncbi:MAG: HAMP domain-containing methyl-accepting chemotaxis protein [Spirochaetales bacterium]|nr:HAMP domain-containing methyl-accepting chemotaxis protein [Spirochaetales bacterium]
MKIRLTFKQKMALVLVLAILGFAVVTTLGIAGLGNMSTALAKAESVAKGIGEASQIQLTLLKVADNSRTLEANTLESLLQNMDQLLAEHKRALKKELLSLQGSALANDIVWIDSASDDFGKNFHRFAELKATLGFNANEGLIKTLVEFGEKVKKEIWFGSFSEQILQIQVDSNVYLADGAPELATKVVNDIEDVKKQLVDKNMAGMETKDGITFLDLIDAYAVIFHRVVEPRTELHSVEIKINELMESIKKHSTEMNENGNQLLNQSAVAASAAKTAALTKMASGAVVTGVLLCLVLIWISRDFLSSLKKVIGVVDQVADGDISIEVDSGRTDEIGHLLMSLGNMVDKLKQVCVAMEALAEGDLTFDLDVDENKKDELRKTLMKVRNDLSFMVSQQIVSGQQISSGSVNVSDFSQSLSQGATESAASLEEISSSLYQMSSQTKLNAENANQVNILSSEARTAAEEGNSQMERMVTAMAEINTAGQNINKIIKVIDEIAFQTNLLALNAAVEAARAGQHGKGFAVVAEEVRNLAARSAKAASETGELIAGTVDKTQNGVEIANQTAKSLEKIYGGVSKVSDLAEDIATASNEQASGIGQINQGLGQIDRVIQQNTATAEESASAAEELSSQAAELMGMLNRFKLNETNKRVGHSPKQIA